MKKGMMFYEKQVPDPQMGKVKVTCRVHNRRVDTVVYDNMFMPVPPEYQWLAGQSIEAIKTQGFVLTSIVEVNGELPVHIEPDEIERLEESDILERPSSTHDINWTFYDEIVAVEQARDDDERFEALITLGEAVMKASYEYDTYEED